MLLLLLVVGLWFLVDQMFIVSLGTERVGKKFTGSNWQNPNLIDIAQCVPEQFISDANELVEVMMHFIGYATGPLRKTDAEVGDLREDAIHRAKLLAIFVTIWRFAEMN